MANEQNPWPFFTTAIEMPMTPMDMISGLSRSMLDGYSAWSHETTRFLAERLEKDAELPGVLAKADSPAKAMDAYAAFLREAAEDYMGEFSRVGEMMADSGPWGLTAMNELWPSMTKSKETHQRMPAATKAKEAEQPEPSAQKAAS